eukprot:gene27223-30775_t
MSHEYRFSSRAADMKRVDGARSRENMVAPLRMLAFLITLLIFVSPTRAYSSRSFWAAFAKKRSAGCHSLLPSKKEKSATFSRSTSHQTRYCSAASVETTPEITPAVAYELKQQLSTLIDFKLDCSNVTNNAALVGHLMDLYKDGHALPRIFIKKLLNYSQAHQRTHPNVLVVNRARKSGQDGAFDGNVTIVGDVHGQYHDFAQIFQDPSLAGYPSAKNQFIFNGDMVDRGSMAVEIVVVLLVAKLLCPDYVHILRGNHESLWMTQSYGFEKEVLRKYDAELLGDFRRFFDTLPLAAVVQNEIFVTHGGIGPTVANMSLDEINKIDRFIDLDAPGAHKAQYELLWCDPRDGMRGFRSSYRGGGCFLFGADVTEKFLAHNNLSLLIRSQEVQSQGFQRCHNDKCVAFFSAPNYCGNMGNNAAL